jgi:C4-dicarboxylate-specific signal transduction histidine kinase
LNTADEIRHLRACINDLVGILAMPAIWIGGEPHQVLAGLLDVVTGLLRLDFAYVAIKSPADGVTVDMIRCPRSEDLGATLKVVRQALIPWSTSGSHPWPPVIKNLGGFGDVSVAVFRLGFKDEMGALVAGSRCTKFPTQTERLLLNVAANQAAIGLQEARQLGAQMRLAQELDLKVAQRTEELVAANKALKKEIAQRKDAEEALRQAHVQLSRATQVATAAELSASIAHEINQPLAAVVANAHASLRWLSATPPNLERVREAVERIIRDGKDAGEVVRRVRSLFSGAAADMGPLDLNELVVEVVNLLQMETTRKQIVVEPDLASGLPPATGDRVQLQQLVLNLLLNGIEAMDMVLDRPKRIFIRSSLHQRSYILVEVEDNGIGLDDPEKVFEAFFTTKMTGMGMGLAISPTIIQAHHGRLWAERRDGIGAKFCFTVPLEQVRVD